MDHRDLEVKVELEAPAADVWKAISDAEEMVKWFAPQVRVKPGEGGDIFLSWGGGVEGLQKIEIWEPERRLRIASDAQAIDYFMAGGSGGTTVLRVVQTGFGEYESTLEGWKTFFFLLKHFLERHRGEPAVNVTVCRAVDRRRSDIWAKLLEIFPTGELAGTVEYYGAVGYRVQSFGDMKGSLLAMFAERADGKTLVTLTWILRGDSMARASELRARSAAIINGLAASSDKIGS